jgi:prevent-host-death family protein
MRMVDVQEGQAQLSDLLALVELGEDVIIARAGSPVARLVLVEATAPRSFGGMTLTIPDDFDAPMSDTERVSWE